MASPSSSSLLGISPFGTIQDTSSDGNSNWKMVTVLVGSERRAFQVHRQLLGPLAKQCSDEAECQVLLPDNDPETFNLVMLWIHYKNLPRVKNLSQFFDRPDNQPAQPNTQIPALAVPPPQRQPLPDNPVPCAELFTPVVIAEPPEFTEMVSYCNLGFHEQFRDYSADELRLHYMHKCLSVDTPGENLAENAVVSPEPEDIPSEVDSVSSGYKSVKEEIDLKDTDIFSLPTTIPDDEARMANKTQRMLLQLLIFAEKHKWEPLFNDAMDAFIYGEAQLRRQYVPPSYICLAFSRCQSPSQVQNFIGDHAITLGCKNNRMTAYQDIISLQPAFFAFLLCRMDSTIPAGYQTQKWCIFMDKTDRTKIRYHIHNGGFFMGCTCSTADPCFTRSGQALPLGAFTLLGDK